jgi:Pyruvate phosphate dikinase, AMP/ATP-binding domain/PEP-utilising enzyme, mobile domain
VLTGLDDPAALDPLRVGAKAAGLAQARLAGLSVLPGVVIDVARSLPFLADAVRVAAQRGAYAGQLVIMDCDLPAGLADAVRQAVSCQRLVVRSSSPVEESGEWSGAFASYTDVGPAELEAAVRGCWSSMLGRDALARFEQAGRDPAATGMAVLIQPAITPSPGGVAQVDGDVAHITVADDGQLPALLQGLAGGKSAEMSRHRGAHGPAVEAYGRPLLARVAGLAWACQARTGLNYLEWAFAGEHCYLLQARRVQPRRPRRRTAVVPTLAGNPFVPIARAAARFGGAAGDELVLPWYLAPGGACSRGDRAAAAAAWPALPASRSGATELRCAARALTAQAWRTGEDEAAERARSVITRLRDRLDPHAAAELGALAPIDAVAARRIVATVERAAAAAVAAEQLFDATDAWRLSPAELDRLLTDAPGPQKSGPAVTAWEPFLAEVARAGGRVAAAQPASAGFGAGRLLELSRPQRLAGIRDRRVLHVAEPLPAYAPLLWGAAGLISATGSPSAHLFEVARTLGVPAVAGASLPGSRSDTPVVAVDGTAGQVFTL